MLEELGRILQIGLDDFIWTYDDFWTSEIESD